MLNSNMIKEFKGMVDKRNIFNLIGCYCNNPKLILNEKTSTKKEDYPEPFHRLIFGAIYNIAKKNNIKNITAIDIENYMVSFPQILEIWKNNNGIEYINNAISMTKDKVDNALEYKDIVRKYSIIRHAVLDLEMDVSFIYNENDDDIQSKFNKMTSSEVLSLINDKVLNFKEIWSITDNEEESFSIGDDIEKLLEKYQKTNNIGYPYQSSYLTNIFSGMLPKRYTIISSKSGGGKSRVSMANACNISCQGYYDWNNRIWISTGEQKPCLYISTELIKDEIQLCCLSHISGISPKRIKEYHFNDNEKEILSISSEILKQGKLYCEYIPNFNIESISDTIERYILNHNVQYVFFDYINETPELYNYYISKSRSSLRTDQVLYMFSNSLKQLVNKYNIYLYTSTQLNRGYKEEENKDASALKGSNSVPEKADNCAIMLPATQKELKLVESIINERTLKDHNFKYPNTVLHVYKVRDGEHNNIKIFLNIDLGCVRVYDCFVTDSDYKCLNVEKIKADFGILDVSEFKEKLLLENKTKICQSLTQENTPFSPK